MKQKGEDKKVNLLFIIAFLFSMILFSSPVLAEDLKFKQYQQASIARPCFNNGTFCSTQAICNSTVVNPNGRVILNNSLENNQGSVHNLTIRAGNLDILGIYDVSRTCIDPAGDVHGKGSETYVFLVTPSGSDDNSIAQFILIGFILIFSVGAIVFGINYQDPWITLFGSFVLTLLGLYTLLNGLANYRNDLTEWGSLLLMSISIYVMGRTGLEVMDVF